MAESDSCDDMNGGAGGGGGDQGDKDDDDNVCRDFLRNVCRRGKRCKYRHPDTTEAKEMGRKVEYVFCHDFQNKECYRINCKFIHCSREDEEFYQKYGELPPTMSGGGGGGDFGGGIGPDVGGEDDNRVPLCKDFQKGECFRGGRCKFRHVNEYDMDMGGGGGGGGRYGCDAFGGGYGGGDGFDHYEPERKRRMFGNPGDFGGGGGGGMLPPPPPPPPMAPPPPPHTDYYILEEANAFLRRKVEELKKQAADLTATNEFLLDQNAQLRVGKQPADLAQALNPSAMVVAPGDVVAAAAAPVSLPHQQNPLISYPIVTQAMRPALAPGGLAR